MSFMCYSKNGVTVKKVKQLVSAGVFVDLREFYNFTSKRSGLMIQTRLPFLMEQTHPINFNTTASEVDIHLHLGCQVQP